MAMNMNFSDIIKFKMMSKLLSDKGELDMGKIMMLQAFTNDGRFEIQDAVKAKLMTAMFGENADTDKMSDDKLLLYSMLSQGNLDIGKLLEYKLMSKLLLEDEAEKEPKKKSEK